MPNDIPTPSESNAAKTDWLKLDDALKKYALAIITMGSIGITILLGPQSLYFVIGVGAIATFAIYPDIEPEYSLFGSIFGAIYAGPLGLLAGAFVGYYIGQKYEKTLKVINAVASPVYTVMNIPTQIKNGVKNIANAFLNGFSRVNDGARQFFDHETDKVSDSPILPTPASPIAQGAPATPGVLNVPVAKKKSVHPVITPTTPAISVQGLASEKVKSSKSQHQKTPTDIAAKVTHQPRMTRAQASTKKKAAPIKNAATKARAPVISRPPIAVTNPNEPTQPSVLKRGWNLFLDVWGAANEFYERELDIHVDTPQEKAAAPLRFSQQGGTGNVAKSIPTAPKRKRSRVPMGIM